MDGPPSEGAPARNNVVRLDAYRRVRASDVRDPAKKTAEPVELHARVYVDLTTRGELTYGLSCDDGANALYLLEPLLYLGSQLLKLHMESDDGSD